MIKDQDSAGVSASPFRISDCLVRVFQLDRRSLALFRIALGVLILGDLAFRLPTLTAMVTGDGFFTDQLSREFYRRYLGENWNQYVWSVYWLNDSPAFASALFGVAGCAAVLLILGKWTRVATIVSWLLIVSLQNRNPLITTSGDFLFKMMLFWSIFLPLGSRWSLDARATSTSTDSDSAFFSIATVGFVFQVFATYFFPGLAKWNEIWFSGDAMWFVLRLDIYITEVGRAMLEFPGLLRAISWATLATEVFCIWTLFSPWKNGWFRLLNMGIFWSFHLGIALCLSIGLFPWICLVAWLPLLPGFIWNRLRGTIPTPLTEIMTGTRNRLSSWRLAAETFCLVALLIVIAWNVSNIEHRLTRSIRIPLIGQLGYQLGLDQHFQMFGEPPAENPWFVYEAQLVDGTKIDIFRNTPIDYGRPAWGRKVLPQFHWRQLHRNALHGQNAFLRQPLLDYAVKKWNAEHPEPQQVARAKLSAFQEPIGPDYNSSNFVSQVWGSYAGQAAIPGSLFDSLIDDPRPPGF